MAEPAAAQPEDAGFFSSPTAKTLIRTAAIYFAVQWATGALKNYLPQPTQSTSASDPTSAVAPSAALRDAPVVALNATPSIEAVPLWPPGSILDVLIKLTTSVDGLVDFNDHSLPEVEWKGLDYGPNSKWSQVYETEFHVPASVQKNGSLWADVFITLAGVSPNPNDKSYNENETLHLRKLLTRYYQKQKVREVKNLISGSKANSTTENVPPPAAAQVAEDEAAEKKDKEILPIISYYHPNLTFQMIVPGGVVAYSGLPPPLQQHIQLAYGDKRNEAGKALHFPITWANDFWILKSQMMIINETVSTLPLRISFDPSSIFKWQIMASLDDNFRKSAEQNGGSSELDEVKRMLTETNPLLLITTFIVSMLHMLFEFLAFTSDITHWRNKKELVGVSVRTILTNCAVQLIILLYLFDNNENTSWMILGGQGVGLLIEAWKITKAVDINIVPAPDRLIGYTLDIKDKHVLSEDELKTQEYDALAFKWVSWGTIPALVGYTIYSMFYNEHRSWYSFTISTLTSFVYAFGFVQLIPQLIINYKLKSVAHMPLKTMMFKFFNTIVDDFFSFIIKMPFLHRLACFRDDVVFVILLYQMWIYKVDPTRANEYGQMLSKDEAEKLLELEKQKEKEKAAAPAVVEGKKDKKVDSETKKNK
ncbi:cleft lip and palate transmembrane 1 [Meredithblackwellia eburnea MCA 4105]